MKPKRIQRKRTKGYKLPENTVCVNRPTKWGNPFKLIGDMIYVDAGHRRKILDKWVCYYPDGGYTTKDVVKLFEDLMFDIDRHRIEPEIKAKFQYMRDRIHDLKGRNLACFCKEGVICHGDILLKLSNNK